MLGLVYGTNSDMLNKYVGAANWVVNADNPVDCCIFAYSEIMLLATFIDVKIDTSVFNRSDRIVLRDGVVYYDDKLCFDKEPPYMDRPGGGRWGDMLILYYKGGYIFTDYKTGDFIGSYISGQKCEPSGAVAKALIYLSDLLNFKAVW